MRQNLKTSVKGIKMIRVTWYFIWTQHVFCVTIGCQASCFNLSLMVTEAPISTKNKKLFLWALCNLMAGLIKTYFGIPALSWNFIEVNCHKIGAVVRSLRCWPKRLWPLFSWLIPTVFWPADHADMILEFTWQWICRKFT